jgi:DNA-binding MarR family transcriptional regulator
LTAPSSKRLSPRGRADQAANLLGALGTAVGDRVRAAVTGAAGGAVNDATALSAMLHFLEDPRIDQLAQVLGLTSSGTVRLVDRLQHLGLVQRSAGADARATTVALTTAGRARAEEISGARIAVLERALAMLSPAERDQFGVLAGKLLAGIILPPGAYGWLCRLCDTGGCGRPEGHCPVANAATAAASTGSLPR